LARSTASGRCQCSPPLRGGSPRSGGLLCQNSRGSTRRRDRPADTASSKHEVSQAPCNGRVRRSIRANLSCHVTPKRLLDRQRTTGGKEPRWISSPRSPLEQKGGPALTVWPQAAQRLRWTPRSIHWTSFRLSRGVRATQRIGRWMPLPPHYRLTMFLPVNRISANSVRTAGGCAQPIGLDAWRACGIVRLLNLAAFSVSKGMCATMQRLMSGNPRKEKEGESGQ
jgi:hypothetical protein